jgi:aminoglycoside phosphotransferase (APT) family kinase protein
MIADVFEPIPAECREIARAAVSEVFGPRLPLEVTRVTGGVSALTYRLDMSDARWLLRIDAARDPMRNPQRGYACMRAAAEAGLAPRLLHADAARGVALMAFVETQPLARFPGGAEGLVRALGALMQRLHELPAFPVFLPFPDLIARMLAFIRGSGLFAPGLLDRHAEGFERVCAAYRWDPAALGPSHNDPNARNVLFDGERLWLIDWETAFQNDPLTDVAIVCDNIATTPALRSALLEAYFRGQPVAPQMSARLALMQLLTRLYYACLLLAIPARVPRAEPHSSLEAPTVAEFHQQLADGRIREGQAETIFVLGKMLLAGFLSGLEAADVEETLSLAASA